MRGIAVLFLTLALSVASAKSYTIKVFMPTIVAGTELAPGEYRLDLEESQIRLRKGSVEVEAKVRVETVDRRILRLELVDGKHVLKEVLLGGTNTRLVLD